MLKDYTKPEAYLDAEPVKAKAPTSKPKPKYRTPSRLKITRAEYDALLEVRKQLATGRFAYIKDYMNQRNARLISPVFNMAADFDAEQSCGTVGCIGGWMGYLMEYESPTNYVQTCGQTQEDAEEDFEFFERVASTALHDLFFPNGPDGSDYNYQDITPKQAIRAIDNFLTTGKPNWKQAISRRVG